MNKRNRKQLRNNIIKFVLWIFLLAVTLWHLHNHPAEKRSRNTWAQVLRQKIDKFFGEITGTYDPLTDYKLSMINSYKEILYVSQTTACLNDEMKAELDETFKTLQEGDLEHFKLYKDNYYLVRSQYRTYIETNCSK